MTDDSKETSPGNEAEETEKTITTIYFGGFQLILLFVRILDRISLKPTRIIEVIHFVTIGFLYREQEDKTVTSILAEYVLRSLSIL